MGAVKVIAGDVEKGKWSFGFNVLSIPSTAAHPLGGEAIDLRTELERVEQLSEEKQKKLLGTAGWGLAGAVALGPIGAVGGLLLGGNRTEVCFAAYLKDGRKFMATTDMKTWQKIAALVF